MYLNEADILSRQLDEDNTFGPRSVLLRAHALVLSKQHKAFKRDLKPAGLAPEQVTISNKNTFADVDKEILNMGLGLLTGLRWLSICSQSESPVS